MCNALLLCSLVNGLTRSLIFVAVIVGNKALCQARSRKSLKSRAWSLHLLHIISMSSHANKVDFVVTIPVEQKPILVGRIFHSGRSCGFWKVRDYNVDVFYLLP